MMKLLVLFASVLLASAKNINVKQLEYGFCDGAPQPLSIDELTVLPDPVELRATISATITLNEIVPTGSQVELSISKNFLGVPVPIPCLEINGLNIGSCKYDADHLLTEFADFLCPAHFPDGQACATPLNPGTYGGRDPIMVEIPEIPDIIAGFLGSGEYHASATVTYPDGSMMTCIQIKLDVVG